MQTTATVHVKKLKVKNRNVIYMIKNNKRRKI